MTVDGEMQGRRVSFEIKMYLLKQILGEITSPGQALFY